MFQFTYHLTVRIHADMKGQADSVLDKFLEVLKEFKTADGATLCRSCKFPRSLQKEAVHRIYQLERKWMVSPPGESRKEEKV